MTTGYAPRVRAWVALVALLGSRAALADGAFPEENQLFLPVAFPEEMVLGTNFGVLLSEDEGKTWSLVCESLISPSVIVNLYAQGSDDALFAGYGSTIAHSLDHGCTWTAGTGLGTQLASDFFADPTTPTRVFALGTPNIIGGASDVYLSTDEGDTFVSAGFEEPDGNLTGVEVAASDGNTVYVAGAHPPGDGGQSVPYLLDSANGGQTWTRHDHPELGDVYLGIATVDPSDADTLYLRSGIITGHDSLQISHDRGATLSEAVALGEAMSGFALASDGTLYTASENAHLWVEAPGASSFTELSGPHSHCLGARGTTLFICGDQEEDGMVLATSTDRGASFQNLLDFNEVGGLATCAPVQSACGGAWAMFEETFPHSSSSGSGGSGGKGCGCEVGSSFGVGLLIALGALRRARSRRRR